MSHHSYSRCWLHLIWATHNRERMLQPAAGAKVSGFLLEYAREKGFYMKTNFVNPEHVHVLIDLPTNMTIENAAKLLKGASSHWINESNLLAGKFAWGRGHGAFSVSQSDVSRVARYIADQEEHHRTKSFAEEYQRFVKVYGLVWRDEETVETVESSARPRKPLVETRG
jgi:putative transposase